MRGAGAVASFWALALAGGAALVGLFFVARSVRVQVRAGGRSRARVLVVVMFLAVVSVLVAVVG